MCSVSTAVFSPFRKGGLRGISRRQLGGFRYCLRVRRNPPSPPFKKGGEMSSALYARGWDGTKGGMPSEQLTKLWLHLQLHLRQPTHDQIRSSGSQGFRLSMAGNADHQSHACLFSGLHT